VVNIRLLGMLKTLAGNRKEIDVEAAGQTISQAVEALGINPQLVALVLVNEAQQSKAYVLQDGDQVQLMAVVGGG